MASAPPTEETLNRPIAQASVSTAYFERARVHHSRAEFQFYDPRAGHPADRPFHPLGVTTAVRNYILKNVMLDADTGLLVQDGVTIPETSYFVQEEVDLTGQRAGLVKLDAGEDAIIGYNNAHGGYQHWLTQCVPAIDWSLRHKRTRPARLVLPSLAPWQEEILDILGHRQIPRVTVKPNTFYHLPHVEFSEFLNGTTSFGICMSAYDTMRRLLQRLPPRHSPYPILFVPCSNPYYGVISNAEDVTVLLRRRGVFVVNQHLSTAARINLFRNADVVIGPLGQGLADILFCKPGTLLWEWMPQHHQNASYNRLAQAAEVDYWGEVFESDAGSGMPREWTVDEGIVTRRLSQISQRLALRSADTVGATRPVPELQTGGKPLDELMLAFESLGDNCEFGLVQRHAGAEPLGLLRFAGMSLNKLLVALEAKFSGIGTVDTVTVYPAGERAPREFMVHETWLDTRYHTFNHEGEIEAEDLRQREAGRLGFLRRKILEDLERGEKIWVWREYSHTDPERIRSLVEMLRDLGPNTLLWVVAADEGHAPGTVERLNEGFIKGYVERLATYSNATDISPQSWYTVCENAYYLCHPEQVRPDLTSAPDPVPTRVLSAMEILAQNPAALPPDTPPRPVKREGWFSRLWS